MRAAIKVFRSAVVVSLLSVVLVGCGGQGAPEGEPTAAMSPGEPGAPGSPGAPGAPSPVAMDSAEPSRISAPSGVSGGVGAPAQKSIVPRKIIYTADISMAVEKLDAAQKKLLNLVRQYGGYIAETNVGGQTGAPRTGHWKVRVPVDGYQNFVDAVTKVGEVQTINTGSEDVSAEYYDIQARLRNKQVEEKRLIEHLNRSTAKLSDILLVEKEISRVREEIERMQGRLQVLANLTSLTTVTVTLNEIKDYQPPAPPTFGTEISRSFQDSFGGLINLGKNVVLLAVAMVPWLVVLIIIVIPVWIFRRRPSPPKE